MLNFPKTQLLIESLVSERIVPGVNYALLKGDQVFASTLGFASIYPAKSQLSPFAYYDLASCSKVLATKRERLTLLTPCKNTCRNLRTAGSASATF